MKDQTSNCLRYPLLKSMVCAIVSARSMPSKWRRSSLMSCEYKDSIPTGALGRSALIPFWKNYFSRSIHSMRFTSSPIPSPQICQPNLKRLFVTSLFARLTKYRSHFGFPFERVALSDNFARVVASWVRLFGPNPGDLRSPTAVL